MTEESKRLLGRWVSFEQGYPALASELSRLAQAILSQDRIDAAGVERTIQSKEMLELRAFLAQHSEIQTLLEVYDPQPTSILKAVDLFATALIFHHETRD